MYVTFLQRKCGDYEIIIPAFSLQGKSFCAEICNLCGESAAYFKKNGPRMNMQTLVDYALIYAITFSGGTDYYRAAQIRPLVIDRDRKR